MTSTRQSPKKGLPLRLLAVILVCAALDAAVSFQVSRWAYVDNLFSLEVGIGAFVFIGCVGFIIWSLLFSRAEKYDESDGLPIEGNTKLEITWTVIPFVIVMALAFYSIHVNEKLASGPSRSTTSPSISPPMLSPPWTLVATSDPSK